MSEIHVRNNNEKDCIASIIKPEPTRSIRLTEHWKWEISPKRKQNEIEMNGALEHSSIWGYSVLPAQNPLYFNIWDWTDSVCCELWCNIVGSKNRRRKKVEEISTTFSNLRNSTDFATQFKIQCSRLRTVSNRNPTRAGKLFNFTVQHFYHFSFTIIKFVDGVAAV